MLSQTEDVDIHDRDGDGQMCASTEARSKQLLLPLTS